MTSLLLLPRTMLRHLAARAASSPIEVVVSIFVIVTLAYFQLLHAIATSNFFDPLNVEARGLASATSSSPSASIIATPASLNNRTTFSELSSASLTSGPYYVRKAGSTTWARLADLGAEDLQQPSLADSVKRFSVEPILLIDGDKQMTSHLSDVAEALQQNMASSVLDSSIFIDSYSVHDPDMDALGVVFSRIAPFSHSQSDTSRKDILQQSNDAALLQSAVEAGMQRKASSSETGTQSQPQLIPILSDEDAGAYFPASRLDELRSVQWVVYAGRALVMRFWALLNRADSADIFVMLMAYVLMHGTFVNLFLSMRKFGSNFWLGASVLTSSICAFLCALTMAYLLGVTVDPICLSEALPFLVIIVGFEKPFLLTKAVFTHSAIAPQATTPNKAHPSLLLSALNDSQQATAARQRDAQSQELPLPDNGHRANMASSTQSQEESFVQALTARLKTEPSLRWAAPQPVPAQEVVISAVDLVGGQIMRDYAIEIAVMAIGATSGVSGLREFCQLAALILIFDCIFLFAFMVSTLTIMVEVHRIKVMRGMKRITPSTPPNVDSDMEPSGLNSPLSSSTREFSPEGRTDAKIGKRNQTRPLWRKVVKLVLGKVPFEPTRPGTRENPVARLKLLVVTAFLTLHSLNLVSTLTTQAALYRHHSTGEPTLYRSILDSSSMFGMQPSSQVLAPMLDRVAAIEGPNVDLVVQVRDPIIFVLLDSSLSASSITGRSTLSNAALNASGSQSENRSALPMLSNQKNSGTSKVSPSRGASSLAVLDSFMIGWTVIVGDPVISKWISIALGISIFLNAYLLKGIASGNAAVAEGNAAGAAAFAAARMIGAHLDREEGKGSVQRTRSVDKVGLVPRRDSSSERLTAYHKTLAAQSKLSRAQNAVETDAEKQTSFDDVASSKSAPMSSESEVGQKHSGGVGAGGDDIETTPQLGASKIDSATSDHRFASARPFDEIVKIYAGGEGVSLLNDEEVVVLVQKGKLQAYALEKVLQDNERAVRVRRSVISRASSSKTLEHSLLPLAGYDYAQVIGACCENVVGFMPLPLGIAGPLNIDGQLLPIPMATTEGTLVASTSRGCKAINSAGGVTSVLTQDAMTRGPAVEFSCISQAAKAKRWIDSPEGASTIKEAFDSTSRFARLSSLRCVLAGRTLYIRFATSTGDAMGMNMVSKGVEKALNLMSERFEMQILSLSGNYCIDKKPSAINWIEGRGKSVCCEAVIPAAIVKSVLKSTVKSLVNLNIKKNLIGSAMAGSVGGFNAHAANIVAAIFLATGQDPAQVVESSMCMTLMEAIPSAKGDEEDDLLVTVSMPAIEVGTVGGGTILSPQRALLEMLGVAGASKEIPGANSQRLARIIASAVMAGELSLMGALSAGHLIQAHMKHNRSVPPTPGNVTPTSVSSNGFLGITATSTTTGSRPDTPHRFQSSMTPLVAPPVTNSNPASRTSPASTMTSKERRAASSIQ